ncbi:MAG: CRISPR-associated endonuclease Cas2 [Calothrix sp. MO_167.B12]|nr:CRISPR-associated endonuclease Cas2 [Calothrix sp. MO_167.B12]
MNVPNDKRRTKLAKLIERRCQRVQYSVFEYLLDKKSIKQQLEKYWLPVLTPFPPEEYRFNEPRSTKSFP